MAPPKLIFYLAYALCLCFSCSANSVVSSLESDGRYDQKQECMVLQSKVCTDLPYNRTNFPNILGHQTQEDADREIESYKALINVKCSSTLKLFLCVLYFPVCNVLRAHLKPCRSLCEENRRKCEPVMLRFNFGWAENLRCDQFQYYSENKLCINDNSTDNQRDSQPVEKSLLTFKCPDILQPGRLKSNPIKIGRSEVSCSLPCNTTFFASQEQRRFARHWVLVWAVVCFLFTLLSVITFLLDRTRFQYPERPFVYIIMCYCMMSAVYITGYGLGDSVSCATNPNNPNATRVLVRGTNQNTPCAILFMVEYFFMMASSLWWLILTFTWLLASSFQWAQESISNLAHYFHFLAWAVPAAMTITLLILGEVEADSLTGICFTGITNRDILLGFVIIPNSIFLLLGVVFLLIGFASLIKIRRFVKSQSGGRTEKFEKLIMRIGFLGALYIVPAFVTLGIWTYEAAEMPNWMIGWWQRICTEYGITCPAEAAAKVAKAAAAMAAGGSARDYVALANQQREVAEKLAVEQLASDPASVELASQLAAASNSEPRFEFIMLKYLTSQIIGISFSLWVWSNKTMKAWYRLLQCRLSPPRQTANSNNGATVANGVSQPVVDPVPDFRHPMLAPQAQSLLQQQQQQLQQHPNNASRLAYFSNEEQRIII
ncbi:hypothetical protein BOX15_Mlig029369g1 [Macrostomum lignano]|uniref:Frizzled-1 n=1 Tax=Macrostomum lignano TaxID=282301 RepID=A0A267F897_9PLAT|nr:hypothetical protein BOX15_Mlig029369g1 [Macrostomum lignano]